MRNKVTHSLIEIFPILNKAFIAAPILDSLEGKHIRTETGIEIELRGCCKKIGYARLPVQFRRLTSSEYLFCILERDIETGKKYLYFSSLSEKPLNLMKRYEVY